VLAAIAVAWAISGAAPRHNVDRSVYGGGTQWIDTRLGRVKVVIYGRVSGAPLVIVFHGDAPFERPDYQYRFAASAQRALPRETVAAVLRPGYEDPSGDKSQGSRGLATGDNYSPEVVAALDDVVHTLVNATGASRVTLVGHSGGAALAADVAELDPGQVSRLLLVSCPCDVSAWRLYMARRQFNPLWLLPTQSVSPSAGAARMSARTIVRLVVGSKDDVAPQRFSDALLVALPAAVNARRDIEPGASHNILLDPFVLSELGELERDGPRS
jgi:pimeloyl-ACP methyl ester carboxylesterase